MLAVRGIEVTEASGLRGYIEVAVPLLQSIPVLKSSSPRIYGKALHSTEYGVSFGLATHDVHLKSYPLGVHRGGCGWDLTGGPAGGIFFSYGLPGIVSTSCMGLPALGYKDGDRIGILVDCVETPMLRFFVNGVDVHHIVMSKVIWGKVLYPAFVLNDSVFDIASNPALPGR